MTAKVREVEKRNLARKKAPASDHTTAVCSAGQTNAASPAVAQETKEAQAENASLVYFKLSDDGVLVPDHPSERVGRALILKSLNIEDQELYVPIVTQLASISNAFNSESRVYYINSALGLVRGIQPRDHLEVMLAIQMAAVHITSVSYLAKMNRAEMLPSVEVYERIVNKLMRTFTSQMESLRKHRNGGNQQVFVKHVHVHDGGQAIVGNVSPNGNVAKGVRE